MEDYSRFIATERRAVPTPSALVKDGKCVFGTFDREFETMELISLKKPTRAPQFINRFRLTLWEATEVNLENGILLVGVTNMGLFGKILTVFYDKLTNKVYCWDTSLRSKDTVIAPNLINGSVTEARTSGAWTKYINNFEKGMCSLNGRHNGKCRINNTESSEEQTVEYNFELKRISLPSVVSIPFGKNRPLYTQKDFFQASGSLVINGEQMLTDKVSTAIVDDHRGYYPRRAHYDWVTAMGVCDNGGKKKWLAFNLTRNQSVDQERYNENLLWFENRTSILPPVVFKQSVKSSDFTDYTEWTVRDEHDMVNLKFRIYGMNAMVTHAVFMNIDYYITFGEFKGYLRDEQGHKYIVDGMSGIGEDKTLLL